MPRTLIVSFRLTEGREQVLRQLPGAGPDTDVCCAPAELPCLDGYAGALVDGAAELPADWVSALHRWVERGGCLVAIGTGSSGPAPTAGAELFSPHGGSGGAGEWMVKVIAPGHPTTARVPAEFPLTDRFQPLRPGPDTEVLLAVNVAYRDEPAVVSRTLGAGSITTSGLGNDLGALANPDLALVLGRCLSSAHSTASPHRIVGLGIVGYGPYGGMGRWHGLAARATPGLELVAACDPDAGRRKAAEADFPGLRAYATVEEMAADDDVEAVIVATPPVSHAALAMTLLRAGKHVALEKPMCLTLSEADQLMALAGAQGRTLTVNQNRRWDPDYLAIRRVLAEGLLGELFSMETFVGGFEHPCRAWHSEASISGGAVYDWGSHHLDWALQLMGSPPATVTAHGHKRVWRDVTNLDQVRVHLSWEDGREAEFIQSDVAAVRKPKFYLQGTAGTLVGHYRPLSFERIEAGLGYECETAHHAEAPVELTLVRYQSGWGLTETRLPPLPQRRYGFHRNLADHLLRGELLAVTPESVRPVIAVIEAAGRSAAAGGDPVRLDL
jgi:predicted dehydrogenase